VAQPFPPPGTIPAPLPAQRPPLPGVPPMVAPPLPPLLLYATPPVVVPNPAPRQRAGK
jgi:hypothetical protein